MGNCPLCGNPVATETLIWLGRPACETCVRRRRDKAAQPAFYDKAMTERQWDNQRRAAKAARTRRRKATRG